MKIISWNVSRNEKKRSFQTQFLKNSDAQIICLQEVTANCLKILEKEFYNYSITIGKEFFYNKDPKYSIKLYLVILSELDINRAEKINHINYEESQIPLAYKIFEKKKFVNKHIETLIVQVTFKNKKYTIFNSHLECVASPYFREKQLNNILNQSNSHENNIFCGDYNTFGRAYINLVLFPLFNYSTKEIFVNENKLFHEEFSKRELYNSLDNLGTFKRKTFKMLPFQIDYILLSKKISLSQVYIDKKAPGSDHLPVVAIIH